MTGIASDWSLRLSRHSQILRIPMRITAIHHDLVIFPDNLRYLRQPESLWWTKVTGLHAAPNVNHNLFEIHFG